jgi:hypothetical protein
VITQEVSHQVTPGSVTQRAAQHGKIAAQQASHAVLNEFAIDRRGARVDARGRRPARIADVRR